jgi:hypothetical protein
MFNNEVLDGLLYKFITTTTTTAINATTNTTTATATATAGGVTVVSKCQNRCVKR